jgi:hypothetical protein
VDSNADGLRNLYIALVAPCDFVQAAIAAGSFNRTAGIPFPRIRVLVAAISRQLNYHLKLNVRFAVTPIFLLLAVLNSDILDRLAIYNKYQ